MLSVRLLLLKDIVPCEFVVLVTGEALTVALTEPQLVMDPEAEHTPMMVDPAPKPLRVSKDPLRETDTEAGLELLET